MSRESVGVVGSIGGMNLIQRCTLSVLKRHGSLHAYGVHLEVKMLNDAVLDMSTVDPSSEYKVLYDLHKQGLVDKKKVNEQRAHRIQIGAPCRNIYTINDSGVKTLKRQSKYVKRLLTLT